MQCRVTWSLSPVTRCNNAMPRYCINCQTVTLYSCDYVQGWVVEQLYG